MEEVIAGISFVLIIIFGVLSTIQEINTKSKIAELSLKIKDLEKFRGDISDLPQAKSFIAENEIRALNVRADNLRFCYLCPLYQDKVRADKKQTLTEQQE